MLEVWRVFFCHCLLVPTNFYSYWNEILAHKAIYFWTIVYSISYSIISIKIVKFLKMINFIKKTSSFHGGLVQVSNLKIKLGKSCPKLPPTSKIFWSKQHNFWFGTQLIELYNFWKDSMWVPDLLPRTYSYFFFIPCSI